MKEIFSDSKKELWKILMGDEPMPEPSSNAVQELADALKEIVGVVEKEKNPFIDILYEIRGRS